MCPSALPVGVGASFGVRQFAAAFFSGSSLPAVGPPARWRWQKRSQSKAAASPRTIRSGASRPHSQSACGAVGLHLLPHRITWGRGWSAPRVPSSGGGERVRGVGAPHPRPALQGGDCTPGVKGRFATAKETSEAWQGWRYPYRHFPCGTFPTGSPPGSEKGDKRDAAALDHTAAAGARARFSSLAETPRCA